MARVLIYTSPAMGHLLPALGPAVELAKRGHAVHMITLASQIERVASLGISAAAMDPQIEACAMDDYTASNPLNAVELAVATFARRAAFEREDLKQAVAAFRPDVLVVDTNSFGARTAAEGSGLPWCCFQPFFTPLPANDVPPFGPGFRHSSGLLGRLRNTVLRPVVSGTLEKLTLKAVNPLREAEGLDALNGLVDFYTRPTKTLYFTTDDLDYPRARWPDSFVMCGPATWEPEADAPAWLAEVTRPIVLVTCSTEAQADQRIIEAALQGLAGADFFVVATSAATDASAFTVPANARVERFLPHGPILDHAAAVICHGGMGITQKALAKGVPVCVVPFGRDQLEVARRVEHAGVGVRLPLRKLSGENVRAAIQNTIRCADRAQQMAQAFTQAGGARRATEVVLELCAS